MDASGAAEILDVLERRGETVAVAESLTGGLLAAAFVDVPGASAVFLGGLVAYATELKKSLVGVPGDLLAARGPVDAEVARALARGARSRCGADWAVATTGVAGPAPQAGHPAGAVYVAVAGPTGERSRSATVPGDRSAVRRGTVVAALALLDEALDEVCDETIAAGESDGDDGAAVRDDDHP